MIIIISSSSSIMIMIVATIIAMIVIIQQPTTYPHPRILAARLSFVSLCVFNVFFHLGES